MAKRERSLRNLFGNTYDEKEYWNRRDDPNAPAGWETDHLEKTLRFIREHVAGCETIFDFGPGVGRTLGAYSPEQQVQGFDISTKYKERIEARASDLGITFQLAISTGEASSALPYGDTQFDAAVSCQVFLHQKPENIEFQMAELARVARRVVVITGKHGARHGRLAPQWCFGHDYRGLCRRNGWEMADVEEDEGHIFFVYRRKA